MTLRGVPEFDRKTPHLGGKNADYSYVNVRSLYHPAAEMFPMASKKDMANLHESIAMNGLRVPIIVDKNDIIIDGRNRFRHFQRIGMGVKEMRKEVKTITGDPSVIVFDGDDDQILTYVLDLNMNRRHLSPDDKKALQTSLRKLFGYTARGAKKLMVSNDTIKSTPTALPPSKKTTTKKGKPEKSPSKVNPSFEGFKPAPMTTKQMAVATGQSVATVERQDAKLKGRGKKSIPPNGGILSTPNTVTPSMTTKQMAKVTGQSVRTVERNDAKLKGPNGPIKSTPNTVTPSKKAKKVTSNDVTSDKPMTSDKALTDAIASLAWLVQVKGKDHVIALVNSF